MCRFLHHIIETSLALQYKIQCALHCVVDGNSHAFPLHERFSRLQALQHAWDTGTPSTTFTVRVSEEVVRANRVFVSSGIVAYAQGEHKLHIVQIPSHYRRIPRKEWDIPLQNGAALCNADPTQGLLVVVDAQCVITVYYVGTRR